VLVGAAVDVVLEVVVVEGQYPYPTPLRDLTFSYVWQRKLLRNSTYQ